MEKNICEIPMCLVYQKLTGVSKGVIETINKYNQENMVSKKIKNDN